MSSLMEFLEDFFAWLLDVLLWLPTKAWEALSNLAATAIEAIPAPAWLDTGGAALTGLPGYITYFLAAFQVPEGFAIMLGALFIRFLIRRLPFVG